MEKRTSDLTQIPGFGKKMAGHLIRLGYSDISSLKGQDAEGIYQKHRTLHGPGNMSCRCVLYGYRLAVAYADNDGQLPSDKQNWWNWKD